jgi:hypothetical protein
MGRRPTSLGPAGKGQILLAGVGAEAYKDYPREKEMVNAGRFQR